MLARTVPFECAN